MAALSESDLRIQSHRGEYRVRFERGGLGALGASLTRTDHVLLDRRVATLHQAALAPVLNHPSLLLIDATEEAKSLDRFPPYVEQLVARGIKRSHRLVAIGGGVVQDICCFLAATLMRGVPWRFYPTTLLAQADSCIGSKSSVNVGAIKNILGTYTPPVEIVIDPLALDTLDRRDLRSGAGEMLKVHAIAGPEAFDELAADYAALWTDPAVLQRYVRRSLEHKQRLIELDEFDRGPRNVMNYGHTFGHAIESATAFAIPHGLAVTIGMAMANFVAESLGMTTAAHRQRMEPVLLANAGEFADHPIPAERLFAALLKDKKHQDDGLTLILPDHEGRIGVRVVPNDERFRSSCERFLASPVAPR
jgi:3-dehydroquinate synthase